MLLRRPSPPEGRPQEVPKMHRDLPSLPSGPYSSLVAPPPLLPAPSTISVRAGGSLPAEVTFGPFPEHPLLRGRITDMPFAVHCADSKDAQHIIQVTYSNGAVHCDQDPSRTMSWMMYIRAARDRHEQNIDVIKDSRNQFHFRCLRQISRGEDLLVWFSDHLARQCAIPVLSPANIRGDSEYTCNRCMKSFRFPNTLKSHMRYHCTHAPRDILPLSVEPSVLPGLASRGLAKGGSSPDRPSGPRHLQHAEVTSAFRPHQQPSPASSQCSTKQSPSPHSKEPLEKENRLRAESKTPEQTLQRPSPLTPDLLHSAAALSQYHPVLFQSYLDKMQAMTQYNAMALYSGLYGGLPYCCPRTPTSVPPSAVPPSPMYLQGLPFPWPANTPREGLSPAGAQQCRSPPQTPRDEVPSPSQLPISRYNFPLPTEKEGEPLDLLPKSLYNSKSTKGHMCIYCGKMYSRKYGLKIHLRTHTGYKPLKCKVCQRPFGDPSNLNKHIRLHAEGDTPYRCQHCGKVLVRRRDLERHIRSRHPNESLDLVNETSTEGGSPTALSENSDADPLDESFGDDNQEIQVDV